MQYVSRSFAVLTWTLTASSRVCTSTSPYVRRDYRPLLIIYHITSFNYSMNYARVIKETWPDVVSNSFPSFFRIRNCKNGLHYLASDTRERGSARAHRLTHKELPACPQLPKVLAFDFARSTTLTRIHLFSRDSWQAIAFASRSVLRAALLGTVITWES